MASSAAQAISATSRAYRWRERPNSEPYSLLYHGLDEEGNRLLPKSIAVYAEKPRG